MSTRAQRAAKRRNAQTSTVLVTDAGKDINDFNKLVERLTVEMRPATEHEGFLVGLMAQARWKRTQIEYYEVALLDKLIEGEPVEARIALMMRYAAASESAYYKAHREFTQSRRQRVKDDQNAANTAFEAWAKAPIGQAPSLAALFPGFREPAPQPELASFGKTAVGQVGNLRQIGNRPFAP